MHIKLTNLKHYVLSNFLKQNMHQRKDDKHNFTLLLTLQTEKYAPLGEKFFFKCLKCL